MDRSVESKLILLTKSKCIHILINVANELDMIFKLVVVMYQ
jgi:hypothetical protein